MLATGIFNAGEGVESMSPRQSHQRSRPGWVGIFSMLVVTILLLPHGAAEAKKPGSYFSLDLPDPAVLGEYTGAVRIVLRDVEDRSFAENSHSVGVIPAQDGRPVPIDPDNERVVSVRMAVEHFLRASGLLATSRKETALRADVIIRRYRVSRVNEEHRGMRLRTELFLEFVFEKDGSAGGRVLACGNAETRYTGSNMYKALERAGATHQAAFEDALLKLGQSETFRRLIGQGWRPGAARAAQVKFEVTPIDRSYAYGPSPEAAEVAAKLRAALGDREVGRLTLRDFDLHYPGYLKYRDELAEDPDDIDEELEADAALARRWISDLLLEHLQAFYPGAFVEMTRRDDVRDGKGLTVAGDIHLFDKRGIKNKLKLEIYLIDDATGVPLHTLHVYWIVGSANLPWSPLVGLIEAGADRKKLAKAAGETGEHETFWVGGYLGPGFREMTDGLACDLAALLVDGLRPGYQRPGDIEVMF
jgi:hypothetical protein